MNIQIVPTPDEDRNRILAELKKQGGWIAKAEGRDDFVAIHAGGGTKEHPTIKITQQNVNEVRYAGSDWNLRSEQSFVRQQKQALKIELNLGKGNGVWLLTTVSMPYIYKLFLYANGVTPVCFLK